MRVACRILLPALALAACLASAAPAARAAPPRMGTQAGRQTQSAARPAAKKTSAGACTVGAPVIGGSLSELTNGICGALEGAAGAVGGVAGEAVGAAGNAILDGVAKWMIGAATQVTSFVAKEMQKSTTPQLQSAWFAAQFAPLADLGAALALLVTLVAFASAAIRRDPQALAGTLAGIVRAGLGTTVVVALTALALEVTDEVSAAVLSASPHTFWATVAQAWGTKDFGGFGSSALATLIALVETFGALFVWLELIVRDAAIYLAVLFFPVVLAASIWPALHAWTGRLARLLLLFVVLKPVALIVLSLAGNAAAAGLSGTSGIPGSVGTILAAVVIFALAAMAPWALMFLLAADAESAYTGAGLRTATAGAVAGSGGRSLRNAGGLRTPGGAQSKGGSPGAGSPGGGSGGGFPGGSAGGPSPSGAGSPGAGGGPAPSGGGAPGAAPGEGSLPGLSAAGGSPSSPGAGGESQDSPDSPSAEQPVSPSDASVGHAGGSAAANGAVPAGEETGQADERRTPIAAEAVGGGSIGAAAGVNTVPARARSSTTRRQGAGADSAQPPAPGAAPRPPAPVGPAGASTSTNAHPTTSATVGGASQGSPSLASGDGFAGAPAQERQPPPSARSAGSAPSPHGASTTPVPARHLHVVRDEPKDEQPDGPDPTGSGAV